MIGGRWGATYIDEKFIHLLNKILSVEWMTEFKEQHPNSYIELLNNFRASKKVFSTQGIKKADYYSTSLNVKMPFEFVEFMGDKLEGNTDSNEDEEDGDENNVDLLLLMFENYEMNGHSKVLQLNDEYLHVSIAVWRTLFDSVVNRIIDHCKIILTHKFYSLSIFEHTFLFCNKVQ